MSQYRDHRDAARLRVEALESKLAERDAELAAQGTTLVERQAEITRLRSDLERAGTIPAPARTKPVSQTWAVRAVVAAASLGMVAAVLVRRTAPTTVVVISPPMLADPAASTPDPSPEPTPNLDPAERRQARGVEESPYDRAEDEARLRPQLEPKDNDELHIRRQLEPKVWGGAASENEIKMLKAICGHMGDEACRNRAAAMLDKRKAVKLYRLPDL
jgi:hypothetical protein